jgi:hypothetical protein
LRGVGVRQIVAAATVSFCRRTLQNLKCNCHTFIKKFIEFRSLYFSPATSEPRMAMIMMVLRLEGMPRRTPREQSSAAGAG